MRYQDNPVIMALINEGSLIVAASEIETSFELSEEIHAALSIKKMKAEYHFDGVSGQLVFDRVLGRDENGDFYNDDNGNRQARERELKSVIVRVLVDRFNNRAPC